MLYDRIGTRYTAHRRPDPRIEARIRAAIGDAGTVVNVGGGSGSYEPSDRRVVAVEPSSVMIAQRRPDAAPVVRAVAEALPFAGRSFDAALAILTVHHWADPLVGLRELARVAKRRVVFTFDPEKLNDTWVVSDYFRVARELEAGVPSIEVIADAVDAVSVEAVPVPADCTDGFLTAYWARPEAYLDPGVRAAISVLAKAGDAGLAVEVESLAEDLRSGAWDRRFGHLRAMNELDTGLVLIVGEGSSG